MSTSSQTLVNPTSLTLDVEPGARVELNLIQTESEGCSLTATLGRDSSLKVFVATLGGDSVKNEFDLHLAADGAEAEINGMVTATGSQRVSNRTHVRHTAEHTRSNQLFKYIAAGQSQCEFLGTIVVEESARFTEAFQTNRNLLASSEARMHAEPALEIYCDEVKCSHGAATGQLDEQALFYMRSRGIPEAEARRMLMEAFMADVIDTVSDEELRTDLRRRVEEALC